MKQLLTILTLVFSIPMFAQPVKLEYNTLVAKSQSIHEDESSWYFGQSSIVVEGNDVEISLNDNEYRIKATSVDYYATSTEYVISLNVIEINGESTDIYYIMMIDIDTNDALLIVSDTTEFLLFNL